MTFYKASSLVSVLFLRMVAGWALGALFEQWGNIDMKKMVFIALAMMLPVTNSVAFAEDKKALTPGIIEQIDIASKLTNYGVERNDPLLLLAAAKMIVTLSPNAAASASPLTPAELIEKAKSVYGSSTDIAKLADEISEEVSRGLCYGPGTYYGCF